MVVTSGLPLLMVKGSFTSLDNMTVKDLETFIPFMEQCSVQRASAACVGNRPEWWPAIIPHSFPMQKPTSLSHICYRRHLTNIVLSCYEYHKQQYILTFCAQLALCPESVFLQAKDKETTSLYNAKSMMQILSFNNQNLHYDKEVKVKKEPPKSPRRCLLTDLRRNQELPITDVYLCENCDAEFASRAAITAHERQCYGQDEPEEQLDPTPDDLLGYLQLSEGNVPLAVSQSASQRRVELSLLKNKQVEFSSLLGRNILASGVAKRDVVGRPEKLVQAYEALCFVSVRSSTPRETYSFRCNYKRLTAKGDSHVRPYCFTRAQRFERYKTLKSGLCQRSRELLRTLKPCYVKLTRWQTPSTPLPTAPPLITLGDEEGAASLSSTPKTPSPNVLRLSNTSSGQESTIIVDETAQLPDSPKSCELGPRISPIVVLKQSPLLLEAVTKTPVNGISRLLPKLRLGVSAPLEINGLDELESDPGSKSVMSHVMEVDLCSSDDE